MTDKFKVSNKFSVGDIVICIEENHWGYYKVGKIYTVLEKSENFDQYYSVEFPNASFREYMMVHATPLAQLL